MPIALRFPIALVLSIVCLAAPAWADFQAGVDAYELGDYATALHEWRPLADRGVAEAQYNLGVLYARGMVCRRTLSRLISGTTWRQRTEQKGEPSLVMRSPNRCPLPRLPRRNGWCGSGSRSRNE